MNKSRIKVFYEELFNRFLSRNSSRVSFKKTSRIVLSHIINRGFSLIETVVVVLILGIFLSGVMTLFSTVMGNFTKQEESVVCAGEASALMSQFNRDFELLINRGPFANKFEQAKQAVTFQTSGLLQLGILGAGSTDAVTYSYNSVEKSITRQCNGRELTIGRGRVASFSFTWQILASDTLVRSFPPDPETTVAEPAPPIDGKVVRCWGKFLLVLESPKSNAAGIKFVRQEYKFRVFPVRFNNELRSICSD
ncbi:MAG: type II secretion system protein [Candidatus Ozemobacteraceae bacterium]